MLYEKIVSFKHVIYYGALIIAHGLLIVLGLNVALSIEKREPPSNPENLCSIFLERRVWYRNAEFAAERWNASIPTLMSIMYHESSFRPFARPPRVWVFHVFPSYKRKSTAFGYPQALDATWDDYQSYTQQPEARRDNFADAIDFIAWYNSITQTRYQVTADDAYSLYLAYHEGHTGFKKKTYAEKAWLMQYAKRVEALRQRYQQQLESCEVKFEPSWLSRAWFWDRFGI